MLIRRLFDVTCPQGYYIQVHVKHIPNTLCLKTRLEQLLISSVTSFIFRNRKYIVKPNDITSMFGAVFVNEHSQLFLYLWVHIGFTIKTFTKCFATRQIIHTELIFAFNVYITLNVKMMIEFWWHFGTIMLIDLSGYCGDNSCGYRNKVTWKTNIMMYWNHIW